MAREGRGACAHERIIKRFGAFVQLLWNVDGGAALGIHFRYHHRYPRLFTCLPVRKLIANWQTLLTQGISAFIPLSFIPNSSFFVNIALSIHSVSLRRPQPHRLGDISMDFRALRRIHFRPSFREHLSCPIEEKCTVNSTYS
jgi:hypothetical protein